ncbi:MAG: hypothetical protein AAFV45_09765 [Pseudomonadota bacterium]
MPMIRKSLSKLDRRQRQSESVQMRQLMDVAEAARLVMGTSDEIVPVPRLMIEDQSAQVSAEDAWRTDHFARQTRIKAKSKPAARNEWMPAGWGQLFGFRAAA